MILFHGRNRGIEYPHGGDNCSIVDDVWWKQLKRIELLVVNIICIPFLTLVKSRPSDAYVHQ